MLDSNSLLCYVQLQIFAVVNYKKGTYQMFNANSEQVMMSTSLPTTIELTDEELNGMYGGSYDNHRNDDDDHHRDNDDRRRFNFNFDFDDRFSFHSCHR